MFEFINNLLGLAGTELSAEDLANGSIVDVRTAAEFRGGHVPGSINIPLQELERSLPKFRKLSSPVITCCASGNRSGMAARQLNAAGIKAINGGSWEQVNDKIS